MEKSSQTNMIVAITKPISMAGIFDSKGEVWPDNEAPIITPTIMILK